VILRKTLFRPVSALILDHGGDVLCMTGINLSASWTLMFGPDRRSPARYTALATAPA